jgi:hypothetical protein
MSISMVFHIIMPGRAADPTAGASARFQTPSVSEARCFMHPVMMMDHDYGIMIAYQSRCVQFGSRFVVFASPIAV